MNIKEIFHFNNLFHKIKLYKPEHDYLVPSEEVIVSNVKKDDVKYHVNEWNQEYELIYLSYVLEK
jgi:hypothetical protein